MAHRHSELPPNVEGHHTEHKFARNLSTFDDEQLHLWFSLSYLPGTNDVDALIWHEKVGVFVVEVKGVPLRAIQSYGLGGCEIEGRGPSSPPTVQAQRAMYSLINYLSGRTSGRLPFMVPTACFPRIRRHEWRKRWPLPQIRDLADSMIFEDDLVAGPEVFVERLAEIRARPPVGAGAQPGMKFRHDEAMLRIFMDELSVTAKPLPTPTELERLRQIEGRVRSEVRKEFPTTAEHSVVFRGYPGTGKTFRLLELGISHVQAGRDVLFVCFNKVLASDIRRLLSFSSSLAELPAKLEVADIFELVAPWGVQFGVPVEGSGDHDGWAELVVQAIREQNPNGIPTYDTVLIDEAQDLPAWTGAFLDLFRRRGSSTFVADGPGQELYRQAAPWLVAFRKTATTRQLQRNFRNTKPAFAVAQAYFEVAPEAGKVEEFLKRFRSTPKGAKAEQLTLGFERPEGLPPRLTRIDDEAIWRLPEDSPSFPDVQEEVMVAEIGRLVKDEIDELKGDLYPIDLLILVPDTKAVARNWTKLALDRLGVPYLDYTDDKRRRDAPRREQIRFCTYHSARGVEALRVLVIGFETITAVSEKVGSPERNLGYIVLSRALLTTTVVRNSSSAPSVKFLDHVVAQVARM